MCICQKTGKVAMINWDVLESVRPDHDINGIEEGMDIVLVSAELELILFLVAAIVVCFGFKLEQC